MLCLLFLYTIVMSFPVCLRSVYLSFFRFLCLGRSRNAEDDVLVLAFFFYVFRKPPSNDCACSILYARYTRRDAYKTDNFRPVGCGRRTDGRRRRRIRSTKFFGPLDQKYGSYETYSGRDAYNHNNIPRIWYTIRHVQ